MELRQYQLEAKEAIWGSLKGDPNCNPCAVLPTGAGKTPLLAALCRDAVERWSGRVMVVSHVKELLEQSATTLSRWWPEGDVGVYSAGLKQRKTWNAVTVAGIQSCHSKAFDFGERHLVIVDEAHLMPESGEGMYREFVADLKTANPKVRVVGLTATPYRLTSGQICKPDNTLNKICYSASLSRLIKDGYLCPLVNTPGSVTVDTGPVAKRGGEFVAGDLERAFDKSDLVQRAANEVAVLARERKSLLVFAAGVSHAEHVAAALCRAGVQAEYLVADTSPLERAALIGRFKAGALRALVNVNVLTTGFDATCVDCVVVLRATCSPGLFYQICGRGLRLHPGKTDALILDYGSNIARHGPLDDPNYGVKSSSEREGELPQKICPACGAKAHLATRVCVCGFIFPIDTGPKHGDAAETGTAVLGAVRVPEWRTVEEIRWLPHLKRQPPSGSPTLRVDYFCEGQISPISEWICVEHAGYAGQRARNWWALRCRAPMPTTVLEARAAFEQCIIADTRRIKVAPDPKNPRFWRIHEYDLGEIPEVDVVLGTASWEPEEAAF